MQRAIFFVIIALSMLTVACKKACMGDDMPDKLRFVLLNKQGKNLLVSPSVPLKIWCYSPQGTIFYEDILTPDFRAISPTDSTASFPYRFAYSSLYTSVSSDQGTKDFYLELNGKTDTLHYDVRLTRPNDCFDRYDVVETRFNGQLLTPRTMPGGNLYYVLQRRH